MLGLLPARQWPDVTERTNQLMNEHTNTLTNKHDGSQYRLAEVIRDKTNDINTVQRCQREFNFV